MERGDQKGFVLYGNGCSSYTRNVRDFVVKIQCKRCGSEDVDLDVNTYTSDVLAFECSRCDVKNIILEVW